MLSRFISFLLFILVSAISFGQQSGNISGAVNCATTLIPVKGALVSIEGKHSGAVTDSLGKFIISNLKAGQYLLSISHIGYQKISKKISLKEGQNINLRLFLNDTVFISDAVEIIAPKSNTIEKPGRIHILDAGDIALAPVQSIDQMMDYTSGIVTGNTTGIFSNRVVVTMRGMPPNDQSRTLVIMDGVPLNKADGGSVNWHLLNKNNTDEILITKGPGPAKYGSGAMGGVIEINSARPSQKNEATVSIDYGTFNTLKTAASYAGIRKLNKNNNRIFWNVYANTLNSDGYITIPEVFHTIEDTILVPVFIEEYTAGFKTGIDFNNGNSIEINAVYSNDSRGNGVQVFDNYGAFSKHKTLSMSGRYKGHKNYLKWQHVFFANTENYFRIYEYMNEGTYKLYDASAVRNDLGLNADFDYFRYKRHKISFGFNGKLGSVQGTDTYYTSTDIIENAGKNNIFALYAQNNFELIPGILDVNAGIRYDLANFYDAYFRILYPSYAIAFYKDFETESTPAKHWNALSPRLSLRFSTNDKYRIFTSFARGFRAPVLDDMTRTGNRRGTFAIANPNLKPEFINAFELGGDFIPSNAWLFSASLFYSIGRDFMYYTSTGDTVNMGYKLAPIISRENIGKVSIGGIETEIRYKPHEKISCFLNYTLTQTEITEHRVKNLAVDSNLTGKQLTDIPLHKASAGINWYGKMAHVSLMAKYYGSRWINEFNTVDTEYFKTAQFVPYTVINLRAEKTFLKYYSASFQIENVLNTKFIDSRLDEAPGRMFFLGLKFKM